MRQRRHLHNIGIFVLNVLLLQLGTRQKLRSKYEIISNGLIRTGDIVAELFQNDFLTTRERDDIQQLSSTPVRANEQLLNALMLKDDRAYGCFLTALSNTDQTHIAEILNCEGNDKLFVQ